MTAEEFERWFELSNTPSVLLSTSEYSELIRLNFLVMEEAHRIHNNDMLGARSIPL